MLSALIDLLSEFSRKLSRNTSPTIADPSSQGDDSHALLSARECLTVSVISGTLCARERNVECVLNDANNSIG